MLPALHPLTLTHSWEKWRTWRILLCALHPVALQSSVESLETRREWTEAFSPLTTCTWKGMTTERYWD